MDLTRVINTYGHSPADGSAPGPHIIKALKDEAEKQGVDYRLNTRATEIIMEMCIRDRCNTCMSRC